MRGRGLLGRDGETAEITRLVDGLRDGGGALVICGEAGIGKSALLTGARLVAADRAMTVVTAYGVRSETDLPFAWVGARNGRRQGSVGDVEHDELVTIDRAGRAVRRTVGRRALRRLLRPVAADRAASDRLIAQLHKGHALLLQVTLSESSDASTEHKNAQLAA